MTSRKLNENQLLAAQLLACGHSSKAIADKLSIRPETLSRWKKEAEFEVCVNAILVDAQEATRAKLHALTVSALSVIESSLTDESTPINLKLNTAFKIIENVGKPQSDLTLNTRQIEFNRSLEL